MANTAQYTFVQTHRRYLSKSEPEGELWTLGNDECPCRSTGCDGWILWWGMLIVGEVVRGVGAEGVLEIFISPSQFSCEPKTTLKYKVYFKKILQISEI